MFQDLLTDITVAGLHWDYLQHQGLSPLYITLVPLLGFGDPKIGSTIFAILMVCASLYGIYALSKDVTNRSRSSLLGIIAALILLVVLSAGAFFTFSPLLIAAPVVYLAFLLCNRLPWLSAFLVSLGTVLSYHSLLGYFFIFFSDKKKIYGYTALGATILFILLPMIQFGSNSFSLFNEWRSGFRSAMPEGVLDKGFMASLEALIPMHPLVNKLLLVNFFHFQLLPCLKVRKLIDPSRITYLFGGTIMLFVDTFSSMSTPFAPLCATFGALLCWIGMRQTNRPFALTALAVAALTSFYSLFMFMASVTFVENIVVLNHILNVLLFALWCWGIVNIWLYAMNKKNQVAKVKKA